MVIKPPLNMESQTYRWVVAIALAWLLVACSNDPKQAPIFPTPVLSSGTSSMVDSTGVSHSMQTPIPLASPTRTAIGTEVIPVVKSMSAAVGHSIPIPPERDLVELARQFRPNKNPGIARFPVVNTSDVGSTEQFWLLDLVVPRTYQIDAILRLVTPHAAWYVGKSDTVAQSDLVAAAAVFEDFVYPRVTQAILGFVPEPSNNGPGARIAVLNTRISGAAGYFSSADLYNKAVYDYSNERPLLYLEAEALSSQGPAFTRLVAHELQHLLHSYIDPSEDTWVNEGLSEVISHLVVPSPRTTPSNGLMKLSLTRWPDHSVDLASYYATANLFFRYITNRYRDSQGLSKLIARPEDGIDGVAAFLDEVGRGEDFATVFQDWATANLLGGDGLGGHPYGGGPGLRSITPSNFIKSGHSLEGSVAPFAVDYVRLETPSKSQTLWFNGQATNTILPTKPYSGVSCWWSNRGDSTHTRLSREIDLSGLTKATLRFRAWYNLERSWDFLYVTVSQDGGATWDILPGTYTVVDNPVGTNYGQGLTGQSDGWIQETIDLTPYTGASVLLAFEQVSDDATNLDGACLDDIEVEQIGLFDDAETKFLWTAEGFVRTEMVIPQTFGVRVVLTEDNGTASAYDIGLDEENNGSISIDTSAKAIQSVTVIVSSLTRYTSQPATYTLSLKDGFH